MREERWNPAADAQGYHISTRGNIERWWGNVQEDIEPYRGRDGHAHVELSVETAHYDYEHHVWSREIRDFLVWRLMINSWFFNWRHDFEIYHLDGDLMHNSVDNLRARTYDPRTGIPRIVGVRNEGYGYAFDRRQRGRVEIVETGEICMGVKDAAARIGGNHSNISHVLAGRLETHMGLHFRWLD